MNKIINTGIALAAAAVVGLGAAPAAAASPEPPPSAEQPSAEHPMATVPTWESVKDMTIGEIMEKVTKHPAYPMIEQIKLKDLPSPLQEHIKSALGKAASAVHGPLG